MAEDKPKSAPVLGIWSTVKPFVNGGVSGMLATCVIQPIDMIKAWTFMNYLKFHKVIRDYHDDVSIIVVSLEGRIRRSCV